MIREPYIGMPIFIGGTPGCMPGHTASSRPSAGQNPSSRPPQPSGGCMTSGSSGSMPSGSMPSGSASSGSAPSGGSGSPGSGFDGRLLGSLPIAMTYTPMQQWKTTYPASTALDRGTVFPELDLPWEGGMRR